MDALGGGPGVRTRRYAGEDATDADNNAKLLAALDGLPPERRGARYVCVLALALPGDEGPRGGQHVAFARGTCRGRIARAPRGTGGFGYDPIFEPAIEPPGGRTLGLWTPAEKNAISHRARAARRMAARLADARVLTDARRPTADAGRAPGRRPAYGSVVGFGVGQGVGSTPGSGNSRVGDLADRGEVGLERGSVAGVDGSHQRMADDRSRDRVVVDLIHDRRQLRQPGRWQVGPHRVAHRVHEPRQLPQHGTVLRDRVAQGDEDLLLADGPREVAVAEALARADVGERRLAVEMVASDADRRSRRRRIPGRRSPGSTSMSMPPTESIMSRKPYRSISAS